MWLSLYVSFSHGENGTPILVLPALLGDINTAKCLSQPEGLSGGVWTTLPQFLAWELVRNF